MTLAVQVVEALRSSGATVATAESLTGGRLCATLIDVPGSSAVVAGGIVAYSSAAKQHVLGVAVATLEEAGTVSAVTAGQMAAQARTKFAATYGLSTTGVAGPDASEGKPPGTVFIALASDDDLIVEPLHLTGDRESIRNGTVARSLSLLLGRLKEDNRRERGCTK